LRRNNKIAEKGRVFEGGNMAGDAKGEYRGLAYRNDAELQAWLARRGGTADHRSAPSFLGHAAARPLSPA
jgi:hypothetical protein